MIASATYSQDTIHITKKQAKEAIKNAKRVQALEVEINTLSLINSNLESAIEQMRKKNQAEMQKFSLLQENYSILQTQYDSLKAKKEKNTLLRDILIIIGVFSGGYLAGSL